MARAERDGRPVPALAEFGLSPGDRVRFRRNPDRRWKDAVVAGRERDGSVRLRDPKGAARCLRPEHIEVSVTNERGRITWVPLPQHAAGPQAQSLF